MPEIIRTTKYDNWNRVIGDFYFLGDCVGNQCTLVQRLKSFNPIFAEKGVPEEAKMNQFFYKLINNVVTEFYPCNPNVLFYVTSINRGMLWYKNKRKSFVTFHNEMIQSMFDSKDFFALWDYLEDQGQRNYYS